MDTAPHAGASVQDAAEAVGTRPAGPRSDADVAGGRGGDEVQRRTVALIAVLVVVLAVPMVVALVALLHPRWYPLLDMAWIEMRLRDVWSPHPPLLGLAGRIGTGGHQGSHPGPLSFYAMWPFYRLFGASAWAMEATAVVLNTIAVAVVLWIANRRGGVWLLLGTAAVLAVLLRGLDAVLLTQPWNPYLPVLWWLVFLVAVWSVLCDDLPMLPVAALAGSFCAQTEVAYLGLTVGLGLLAFGVAGYRAYTRRTDRAALRRFAVVALTAAAIAVVVWIPPVIEQLRSPRGNLSVLFDYFTHPPSSPVGFRQGLSTLVSHLNPASPLLQPLVPRSAGGDVGSGSVIPGSLFVVAWGFSVVAAWRLRVRPLMRLHALLGIALVLGALSISRIFGLLWYYLVLWGWGLNAVMVLAVGWTAALLVTRAVHGVTRERVDRIGRVALVGVVVALVAWFSVDAARVERPSPRLNDPLGRVVNPTAAALARSRVSGGRNGRYLITFTDPNSLGAQAFGLMNELERRGFYVGALQPYRAPVTPYRVLDPTHATAIVHLSIGPDIKTWQAKTGAREVAHADPRTATERIEFDRVHAQVIAELNAAGMPDQASLLDVNLFGLSLNAQVPTSIRVKIGRLGTLGLPIAVFLAPPTVEG